MPPAATYPWHRRWLPVDPATDKLVLPYEVDHTGYVDLYQPGLDTEPEWLGFGLAELTPQQRCVVLLGEPGMGKTREWRVQCARLAEQPDHLFVDLGGIDSVEGLRRQLLDSEQVRAWRTTDTTLTLWLDSLDEGLLHVSVLQRALLQTLREGLPLSRLSIRILCRNAVWPASLAEELARLLQLPETGQDGAEAVMPTLLLSPLSRVQVAQAAEAKGFEAGQFLAAVAAADAQPLAGRPVTLDLLLTLYRTHQPSFGIPEEAGRARLYEHGCLALCERPDEDRAEADRRDPIQRLLLAGYVAMLGVLTNRRVLSVVPLPGSASPNELDLYALARGTTVSWRGTPAAITVPALRDVFHNTGLFSEVGRGRVVWAHQSYAEFLAAWYLSLANLPVANLRTLFRSAADPAGGIVPALRETAAWLADLQPTFWEELLVLDPLVLLQSDLRRVVPARRARLVDCLIRRLGELARPPYRGLDFMQHLAHPNLAAQLTPQLADPHAPGAVGRFATDLARVARVHGLRPLLIGQALDPTCPLELRTRALYILQAVADEATRQALRPLREHLPMDDTKDELRGHLLHLLWPTHLPVAELLPLLTRRKESGFYGSYNQFLDNLKLEQLTSTRGSLVAALGWVTRNRAQWRGNEEYRWKRVALHLQRQAWEQVEEADVAEALAEAIVTATEDYLPFIVGGTTAQRQAMLARLLPHHRRLEHHYLDARFTSPNKEVTLIGTEDWPAVYELLATPIADDARLWLAEMLSRLLQQLLNNNSADYSTRYDEFYLAAQHFLAIRKVFAPWQSASDVEQERAERNSAWRQQAAARARKEANHSRCQRSLTLHRLASNWRAIRQVLAQPAAATLAEWQALTESLTITQVKRGTTQYYDVVAAPRWACLSTTQQEAAAAVAWKVINAFSTLPAEWYERGYGRTDGATQLHQALLLLQHHCPARLDELPAAFWPGWAEFLVDHHYALGQPHGAALLCRVAASAPQLVEEAIMGRAARASRQGALMAGFADLYHALPNAAFAARLLAAVSAGEWLDEASGSLLVALLEVDYSPAWTYVNQHLAGPEVVPAAPHERPDLIVPVYQWLLFDQERPQHDSWPWWQRLLTQPMVARRVLSRAGAFHSASRGLRHLGQLSEAQLEELMRWLTDTFTLGPEDVDDWEGRPNGRLAAVRSAIVLELVGRGTGPARDALQRLNGLLGEPFWLRNLLDQARENLRRESWEPLSPEALVTLTREADRRWVRSAADLQELLLESLAHFQEDLHGVPATAQVLWIPRKVAGQSRSIVGYDVHDENYFSNVLRQHLRQDLQRANLLVKREVEIRPALGRGTGQRTDIFVEAFTRSPTGDELDVVTVVIEVKLSKHDKVTSALETQLIDYLKDQPYKHGIYLVGWHYGQYDQKPPSKPDLLTLTTLLAQQAAAAAPQYTIAPYVLDIRLPADAARS